MAIVPYDVIQIPLDVAGQQIITGEWDYFNFIDAQNSDGSQNLGALMNIAFGKDSNTYAPVRLNNPMDGHFDQLKLQWPAQPGVRAFLYVATKVMGPGGLQAMKLLAPTARQLVTLSVGTTLLTSVVSVGNVATLIAAANSLRQNLTIQNDGSQDMRIGGATVTFTGATRGVLLKAGAAMEIQDTTAAIYGVVAAGTADAVAMSENS